ncbi:RNA polymerase sigma factor [Gordonia sp. NPDC003504]
MSSAIESGRMPPSDADIVSALMAGDTAALGIVYDRYGSALHTFAYSMVRNRDRAADVTHDSFVVAAARIHQLRDPDRLRPWLYAIVRSECLRSLRGSKREAAFHEWHDTATDDEPDRDLRRREIQALVRDALGGLSPKDREIVELSLRHDLDNAEIAAVLGVKASHVTALTSRARKALERSLGTLLVARAGGAGCDDLTDLLSAWDGEWTPLWRKRIGKHVDDCPVCVGERRRRFTPAAILVALPLLAVPIGLRVRTVADAEPALVAAHQQAGTAHAATMQGAQANPYAPAPVTMGGADPSDSRGAASPTNIGGREAWTYPVADSPRHRWMLWSSAAALLVVAATASVLLVTTLDDAPVTRPAVDVNAPASATVGSSTLGSTTTDQESPTPVLPPGVSQQPAGSGPQTPGSPSPVSPVSPPSGSGSVSPPVEPPPVDPPPVDPPPVDPGSGSGIDPRLRCPACATLAPSFQVPANPPPVVH